MKKLLFTLCTLILGTSFVWSSSESSLRMSFTRMKEDLKSELMREIPQVSEARKAAYFRALEQEEDARKRRDEAQKQMSEINDARGLVGHARDHWIRTANRNIASAKAKLENATTNDERSAARRELAAAEKNLADGEQALRERTANYERLKRNEQRIRRALEQARSDLERAQAAVVDATLNLGIANFLADDSLDGKLARYVVLKDATPAALARYASQSRSHRNRVQGMLASDWLLIQIAVADGPRKADGSPPDYGRMLDILASIHQASDHASQSPLDRLALATALEHAAPHRLRPAKSDSSAPAHVDPLKRYLNFEKAYLNGELDPHFKDLTVWDMRMVVDGEEPEEILDWGREMLRNYRPDHITTSNHRWRYVGLVRTDIRYGSQDTKYDRDDLQFFQNILKNGGICGRRAFIGRFILRAFGNPTTARPQRGHGALVRWTPDGWVPVLGAGWGSGWTRTPYGQDVNFLATTQARALGSGYMPVKRAHWVGELMGETMVYGLVGNRNEPEFWNGIALYTQRALIADSEALGPVGEELAEANVSDVEYTIETAEVSDEDRKIRVDNRGIITVPAAATSSPRSSQGRINFLPSVLGGLQLNYERTGGSRDFEYSVEVPRDGLYALVGKVATPSWQQSLVISVNREDGAAEMPLPHTVGMWDYTEPVLVELRRGRNTLRFSHKSEGYDKGFAIHEFQLAPVPAHARARLMGGR